MRKSTAKGLISIVLGVVIGLFIFWTGIGGIIGFITSFIVSSILGYFLISPLIMSDKETSDFEQKMGKWFEDDEIIKK
ncbi:hypothetical protein COE51_10135 [Bacillus pseudomycoides]|nr:hypothetical protein COE51_10135 [Bacillus pseudomycoides]